jgi:hypothetical protein
VSAVAIDLAAVARATRRRRAKSGSAWNVSLKIAEAHPLLGGDFRVTHWPDATTSVLVHTPAENDAWEAAHSIYFEVLSEHGWVGR